MAEQQTYWLQETWSVRKRPDGTLEPDQRISGIGITPNPMDEKFTAITTREMLTLFERLPPTEPFYMVQSEFKLIEPARGYSSRPKDSKL